MGFFTAALKETLAILVLIAFAALLFRLWCIIANCLMGFLRWAVKRIKRAAKRQKPG